MSGRHVPASPPSNWIRSIQNQSYQPKPTAYSPHSREDEDPLKQQQRQCLDKLRALRQVRERIKFYASQSTDKRQTESDNFSMHISTSLIFSGSEHSQDWQEEDQATNVGQEVGIDALGGLEMLLFTFFSRQELLQTSAVCRAWRSLARDDLFWEPLLVTPLERYPLRPLLGLEKDPTGRHHVPAILVYMVFQKLRLAQTPQTVECSTTTTVTSAGVRYSDRVRQYLRALGPPLPPNGTGGRVLPRLTRRVPVPGGRGGFASVHLVCVRNPTISAGVREQEQQPVPQMERINIHPQGLQREAALAGVLNALVPPVNAQNQQVVNVQQGAGAADDEDVYSVVDGRQRVTLSSWLSSQERVSETTLRSFLRQMLLAVAAMEQANCEHVDITPVNIVVHSVEDVQENSPTSQPQGHGDEENDVMNDDSDVEMLDAQETSAKNCRGQRDKGGVPLFQLFLSRRNYQQVETRGRFQDPTIDVEVGLDPPLVIGVDEGGARQRQRRIEAAVLGNRLTLPHQSMISSVIQCAVTVWSRGRFVDTNASSLLTLLLRFPTSFPSGLREFLEYAKFHIISHSASADKLLCHEYLQYPADLIARQSSPHWSKTPIHDVNEYKSKLVAHYSSLPTRLETQDLSDSIPLVSGAIIGELTQLSHASCCAFIDELVPRTTLGPRYFTKALKEGNLSTERFVSVVAPSNATSSWVRTLARTQTHTLQRLDLSQARVPTSVLLEELATLPRLTHLRLPRQILRDENLEHLIAELAYSDLLPRLKGLDENVRQAMDRVEKSYLMQLDMFSFLLQEPSSSTSEKCLNTTAV